MTSPDPEAVHCNRCGHKTKHDLLCSDTERGSEPLDDDYDIQWSTTHDMLKCRGCSSVTLRKRFWFSEGDGVEVTFFPPPTSRRHPDWLNEIPPSSRQLLEQIYSAMHAGSTRLAVMGARAAVEELMVATVGDGGSFAQNIKSLKEKGLISDQESEYLNAALEAGHATIHRAFHATAGQASHVMDIVESLFHKVYVLPNAAKSLREAVPPRKPGP